MIHQFVFARAKPGMTEEDFQDYWVNTHAPQYASKIPQFRRYMINLRIPMEPGPNTFPFQGAAEIWFDSEQDELASLQSREYVEGARLDEPNWAAFWQTLLLDTTTHEVLPGPPLTVNSNSVKLLFPVKRRQGMPLEDFRAYSLEVHAPKVLSLPQLVRYHECHVVDASYGTGEAVLDGVGVLWFQDLQGLRDAVVSREYKDLVSTDFAAFADQRYVHRMAAREVWIIGPEPRRATA